ncbi:hypothetical protein AC630_40430 [Bradyrhizobium sp. AS23.2]|nr:hypothetical protein AC630_40430 [Bradyrhizobium sp. AS23.2]
MLKFVAMVVGIRRGHQDYQVCIAPCQTRMAPDAVTEFCALTWSFKIEHRSLIVSLHQSSST